MNSNNLLLDFNKLINWYLNDKLITKNNDYLLNILSKNISNLYSVKKINKKTKLKKVFIEKFYIHSIINKDIKYMNPIIKMQILVIKKLKKFVIDFLIHGSFATNDYSKGWSDLDTYVIIKSSTLEDPLELIKFKKIINSISQYMYKIDPLQHHGFIFSTEMDLNCYNPFLLPLEVLQNSKSLIKKNTLNIKTNDYLNIVYPLNHLKNINQLFKESYTSGYLNHHQYNNKFLLDSCRDKETMYQMKYFLSLVMTLPTYYLHATGTPTYKKYSFDVVKHKFPKYWEIIEIASAIRLKWSVKENHPYASNIIPSWLIKDIGSNYFKRAYNLSNQMIKKIKKDKSK